MSKHMHMHMRLYDGSQPGDYLFRITIVFLVLLTLPSIAFSQATRTTRIPISKDTYLSGALKDTNFGKSASLQVRSVFPSYPLLAFNVEQLRS